MFFIFFCFLFLEAKEIEIDVELGAKHHNYEMEENDIIFIHSIYYPFLIILNNYADNTIFSEYSSLFDDVKQNFQSNEVYMRLLPIYKTFSNPFTFIKIIAKSQSIIKFTLVSIPSMCNNGIYVSTKENDKIQFSNSATDFFNLKANDDKCVVFGSHNTQTVSLQMVSDDYNDQFFVYKSFLEWNSISGNNSLTITQEDEDIPLLVRIVADDIKPPISASISFYTDNDNNGTALFQDFEYHGSFIGKIDPETTILGSKTVAICVLTLTIVLFLIDVALITLQCLKRPQYSQFDDDSDKEMSSMAPDIEIYPHSKFDISRFSNKDLIVF